MAHENVEKKANEQGSASMASKDRQFYDLRTLQEEVNRLFSTKLTGASGDQDFGRGAWTPSVNIYENKEQIVLEAELPGMKQEDFDLSIENNVITLRGERKFEKTDENDNYHRVERSYGPFTRSFTLPQTVSAEGAIAEYNNGVLRVMLTKREPGQNFQHNFGQPETTNFLDIEPGEIAPEQLSAKIEKVVAETALAHERVAVVQDEIEQLKAETRTILTRLCAA